MSLHGVIFTKNQRLMVCRPSPRSPISFLIEFDVLTELAANKVHDFYKGDTASDDEMMQENLNTLVEKIIENGW
jgi:hypothetical protein